MYRNYNELNQMFFDMKIFHRAQTLCITKNRSQYNNATNLDFLQLSLLFRFFNYFSKDNNELKIVCSITT
jgi:hypothetical protein